MYEFEQDDELEVVWSGGPLLPSREQKPDPSWCAGKSKRRYNKGTPGLKQPGQGGSDGYNRRTISEDVGVDGRT